MTSSCLPQRSCGATSRRARFAVAGVAVLSAVLAGCGSAASGSAAATAAAGSAGQGSAAAAANAGAAAAPSAGKAAPSASKAPARSAAKPAGKSAAAAADDASTRASGKDLASVKLKPLPNKGGKVYRVTVKSQGSEQFDTGTVQVWLPNGIKKVRGLYLPGVFVNTDAGDGIPKKGGNREYLALKYHFGIVTHAFTHRAGTPNNRQAYCGYGSGKGLIRAFKALAAKTGHPEIASAPYIMYSYSITNGCAIAMAEMYPTRMIMMSGGGGIFANCQNPAVRKIPMLFVGGRYDRATSPWPQMLAKCRGLGQPVAYALNYRGHEIGDDRPAIEPWWWALIPRRLPANVGDPLLPVNMNLGYLGNNDNLKVIKYSKGAPGGAKMSWLPSAEAAKAWQQWQKPKK